MPGLAVGYIEPASSIRCEPWLCYGYGATRLFIIEHLELLNRFYLNDEFAAAFDIPILQAASVSSRIPLPILRLRGPFLIEDLRRETP